MSFPQHLKRTLSKRTAASEHGQLSEPAKKLQETSETLQGKLHTILDLFGKSIPKQMLYESAGEPQIELDYIASLVS